MFQVNRLSGCSVRRFLDNNQAIARFFLDNNQLLWRQLWLPRTRQARRQLKRKVVVTFRRRSLRFHPKQSWQQLSLKINHLISSEHRARQGHPETVSQTSPLEHLTNTNLDRCFSCNLCERNEPLFMNPVQNTNCTGEAKGLHYDRYSQDELLYSVHDCWQGLRVSNEQMIDHVG